MLFLSLLTTVAGYALLYAGIKGNKAKIAGTPLWRAPWLPFVAAVNGGAIVVGNGDGSIPGGGDPGGNAPTTGADGAPSVRDLLGDLRRGFGYLKDGLTKAAYRAKQNGAI